MAVAAIITLTSFSSGCSDTQYLHWVYQCICWQNYYGRPM